MRKSDQAGSNQQSENAALAIVGIGCRLPGGVTGPESLWKLINDGQDAIVDVPADRWNSDKFYHPDPDVPGKTYIRQGGFLTDDIETFDAQFFGISPREANGLDPQQRLLLETSWEAIDDAGITSSRLAGSPTGVFIGGFCFDSKLAQLSGSQRTEISAHTSTNVSMTMLSNRLSYVYDLHGPSISVDTACSSSLVATHYACQSIWNNECDMALAGGVNVMTRPEYPIVMSKGRYLSPSCRCQMFDAAADGYVRGEGAGIVVIKPLAKALADGDQIYTVIVATGVNQDGRTPGISYPNAKAQISLMDRVYANAGIQPGKVDYIEAHGTGTQAGDLAESTALNHIFSQNRIAGARCLVGSIKTNIGHLEAAAGVAGLIKASMVVKHARIPKNLHYNNPNPALRLEESCLTVPVQNVDWDGAGEFYAAVNSFGYGGTNAHVLLKAPPRPADVEKTVTWADQTRTKSASPSLFLLSARSSEAVVDTASNINRTIDNSPDLNLHDLAYTLGTRRSQHAYRYAAIAENHLQLKSQLVSPGPVFSTTRPEPVFVYSGMGPQWWAMGRELMQSSQVYRDAIAHCDVLFEKLADWSLADALNQTEAASQVTRTDIAQPVNFALQYALTLLWKSRGIVPASVIGHSVGEVAAAWASGALTLEDALFVSFHRARMQHTTAGKGTMLAIGLSEPEALQLLKDESKVSVAAINGPDGVTIAGDRQQLEEIAQLLEENGLFNRFLGVEVAFHSPQMDDLKEESLNIFSDLQPQPAHCELISTVSGDVINGDNMDANYWWQNIRQPVRFAEGISYLMDTGKSCFIELGPHPVLGASLKQIARSKQRSIHTIASLRREQDARTTTLQAAGELFTLGLDIDLSQDLAGGQLLSLPAYPWQRRAYVQSPDTARADRLGNPSNPLLGVRMDHADQCWRADLLDHRLAYLLEHCVKGQPVMPGAGYLEIALLAARDTYNSDCMALERVRFEGFLGLDKSACLTLNLQLDKAGEFRVLSKSGTGDSLWTQHASGRISPEPRWPAESCTQTLSELQASHKQCIDISALYANLSALGLDYGQAFRGIKSISSSNDTLLVQLRYAGPVEGYIIHPVLLDSAIQSLAALRRGSGELLSKTLIPVSVDHLVTSTKYATCGTECWAWVRLKEQTTSNMICDIALISSSGTYLAHIEGLTCQTTVDGDHLHASRWLYEPQWERFDLADASLAEKLSRTLIVGTEHTFTRELEHLYASEGLRPHVCLEIGQLSRDADLADQKFENLLLVIPEPNDPVNYDRSLALCSDLLSTISWMEHTHTINRVTLLTCMASAVLPGESAHPEISPLIGLVRVLANEYPDLETRIIDTDVVDNYLLNLIACDPTNEEVALRKKQFYRQVLLPIAGTEVSKWLDWNTREQDNFILDVAQPGRIGSLGYKEVTRNTPSGNEVEIRAHYWGLNFKDVLKVLGQLPREVTEDTYIGANIGIEASGTVTGTGANVSEFKKGDSVLVISPSAFTRYPIADQSQVVHKPESITSEQAPVYLGFLTAWYALIDIAQLEAGETVLIHNATGGVGLAAIQIARWAGANIIASAGTEEKRTYLDRMGLKRIYDSRSATFADSIRADQKGAGVDVVLGAVSGESQRAGLSLLNAHGRYLEIGKRDIIENTGLPLHVFNKNLLFSAIDFDRLMQNRPKTAARVARDVSALFESGDLQAIPVKVFPASEVADAFRYMSQAKHTGKVVVDVRCNVERVPELGASSKQIDVHGTYLIAGGTSGFGLQIALWLARAGIKNLVLASRRGVLSEEDASHLEQIRQLGTDTTLVSLDITDATAVYNLIQGLEHGPYPLRGIYLAAMVLDDAPLRELDVQRLDAVMRPKVMGALNLHNASRACSLDQFVMFSSISSVIGNTNQGNYVAANAFLDAFSHHRRSLGLPANTINLGVLKDVGVVAENPALARHFELNGIKGFSTSQALHGMAQVLSRDKPQTVLINVDWRRWAQANRRNAQSAKYLHIVDTSTAGDGATTHQLAQMDEASRTAALQDIICKSLAEVLGGDITDISLDNTAQALGVDSLMAVEIALTLEDECGVPVVEQDILRNTPLIDLVGRISDLLNIN